MLLYELYKVLADNVIALIFDRTGQVIYYGSLVNLDVDILQSGVIYLAPINPHEILIKIDL